MMRKSKKVIHRPFILIVTGVLVALLLTSCKQKEESAKEPEPIRDFGPSRELQIAVQNMAALGFIPAAKIEEKEYPYHTHLITIQNQPFFIVDVKQHWFLGRSEKYAESLEKTPLGNVKNAWAYFVKEENDGAMISDAIIEEWQYETQKEAFDAFKEMGNVTNSRYIKEPSYTLQHEKSVYLLYTRAHAFQDELDKLYEMLKSNL